MPYPEPPDITNQPDNANVERILAYLSQLEAVPGDALDALYGLLMRAETAERRLALGRQQRDKGAGDARTWSCQPADTTRSAAKLRWRNWRSPAGGVARRW